jgi:rSAM-associated Gly-rich repeat protein
MSLLNRRQSLKVFLGGLLQTGGTVVVASYVLAASAAAGETRKSSETPGTDSPQELEQRANRIAEALPSSSEDETQELCSFVNGFRKAGFANGSGGGGFRNGAFANGSGGGGFKNGTFANGGGGGGFKNGGFVNGFRN